jgi:ElaB/YqjD/DUF883 family membrane-anchored ribosome-binding protein
MADTPAKKPAGRKAPAKAAPAKPRAAKTTAPDAKASTKVAKLVPEGVKIEASDFLGKAGDRARDAANSGKGYATGALDELVAMVEDLAKTLDDKAGAQYGDYARRAASAVGGVAETLKNKDVDELVEDARDFVRTRPAVAIGAAAAVGFVLTRLVKAGPDDDTAA